jgi:4-amino-4-deoxy-L-arabinose transferase-like glycosyltransferase
VAAGLATIGKTPWGVRAGAGLAFTLWILSALLIGRLYTGTQRGALFAGLCLATAPMAYVGSSVSTSDVFLSATSGLALLALATALAHPERRRLAMRVFWLVLGVGMFIKGPPALFPLVGLVFAWRVRVRPSRGEGLFDPIGLLLFAFVGLGWYVGRIVVDPQGFAVIAWRETVERVSSESLRRNGPVWMALVTLLLGTLPWSPWLLVRQGGESRPEGSRAIARMLGSFAWAGLIVFTLSASRMPLYTMPLTISVSVLAGARVAESWGRGGWRRALVASCVLVTALGLLAARLGGDGLSAYRHEQGLADAVEELRQGANERVLLLQVVPAPGLRFALDGTLDRVALTRTDWRADHELDRPEMLQRLAKSPRGLVAVGPERAFERLPEWVAIEEAVEVEKARGMVVARLRIR